MADEQLLVEAARRGLLPDRPAPGAAPTSAAPSLQDRAREIFGFKDYEKRGTLLPFGITKEGETEFATPQILKDLVESAILPGHVYKGGQYALPDVTRFALDYGVPLTAHTKRPPTQAEVVKAAPSTKALKRAGGMNLEGARTSGVVLSADRYMDFAADLEKTLAKEGMAPKLHDTALSVMREVSKKVGNEVGIDDLHTLRRQIGVAARSTAPELADERRLAEIMIDKLDDMIDNLTPGDLVAGAGQEAKAAESLRQGRLLWSRAKKSELLENAVEMAKTQASGFENGIRIQFRQILRNPKKSRGFTQAELAAMKDVVEGTLSTRAMRLLGKLSPIKTGATSLVGGSIGSAGGAAVGSALGGPAGAAMGAFGVPAAGYMAQRGATRATTNAAELARALAATGGQMPSGNAARLLPFILGPLAGTQIPQDEMLARLLMQQGGT